MIREKILIVDDNLQEMEEVKEALEKNGFYVVVAENGAVGYDLAIQEKPDLIIADLSMPVISGIDLARRLQENIDFNNIPIILTSKSFYLPDKIDGIQEVISKHCSSEIFIKSIQKFL